MFKHYLQTEYFEAERLMSQFTFGFELEAYLNDSYANVDEFKDFVRNFFSETNNINNSRVVIKGDSSINPDGFVTCHECDGTGNIDGDTCEECDGRGWYNPGYDGDLFTFEIASPILAFTPQNLSKTIEFLTTAVNEYDVTTNGTCGFHIHIGFPFIFANSIDMLWALCNLVLNPELFNSIKEFNGVKLFNKHYATIMPFINLKNYLIKNKLDKYDILQAIRIIYNSEKYRAFRQHPQGTLE